MAASLGSLIVSLGLDAAQFTSGLTKAEYNAKQASARITNAFSGLRGAATTALGAFTFDEILKRSVDAEKSLNRLKTVLVTTGYAAGVTADQVEEMSQSLKNRTQFDDDDLKKGIASLLRFRDVQGDVFRQAVELAPDVATALDTDIVSGFQKLGKALADPDKGMRGLREAGVRLSESQLDLAKQMQKTGDLAGAQKLVLDAVTKSVGGAAAGENVGLYGATKSLSKAWDDLLKSFAKNDAIGDGPESFLGRLADKTTKLAQIISNSKIGESLASFVSGGLITPSILPPRDTRTKAIGGQGKTLEEQNASVGQLQRTIEQAQERQHALEQANSEKRIALARSDAESLVTIEKDTQQQRLQVLEALNQDGSIATRDFFAQRRDIIQTSLGLEVQAINQQLAVEAEAFEKAGKEGDFSKQIGSLVTMNKLIEERKRAQQKAGVDLVLDSIREQQELEKVADQLKEINAQIEALKGNQAVSESIKFDLQNKKVRNQFTAAGDKTALAQLNELRTLTVARAEFNDKLEEQSQITARLQLEEDRIQNVQRLGGISELEGLRQTGAARQRALGDLEKTVEQLQKIAETSKNPALILQAEQARAALERLRMESDLLAIKFNTIFSDSFASSFTDFATGAKTAKEAFSDFTSSVLRQIAQLGAQDVAKSIFGGDEKGGGGIGGILSKIFGGGGSRVGDAGSNGGFGGSGGILSGIAALFGFSSFAVGTPFVPHDMLAFIHRGERIVPAAQNASEGGGISVHNQFIIQGQPTRQSQQQIASAAGVSIDRARRRLG